MRSQFIQSARVLRLLSFVCSLGCFATLAALGFADDGSRENIDGDLILMQGKWNLVDFVYYRGNRADRLPKGQRQGTRVVSGNRYRLKLRIGVQQVDDDYSFQLYPQEKPKAFDVTMADGQTVIKGIYEIDADTLRRAYSQPGEERPTQFQSGDQTYQVWKRMIEPPVESSHPPPKALQKNS